MYDELVKELRYLDEYSKLIYSTPSGIFREAADAIEELQQQVEHYHGCMNEWFEAAQEYKAEMPRWIPVTERLPEDTTEVLVCSGIFAPFTEVAFYDGLWYSAWDGETEIESVTHWMPLPEPPEEE